MINNHFSFFSTLDPRTGLLIVVNKIPNLDILNTFVTSTSKYILNTKIENKAIYPLFTFLLFLLLAVLQQLKFSDSIQNQFTSTKFKINLLVNSNDLKSCSQNT